MTWVKADLTGLKKEETVQAVTMQEVPELLEAAYLARDEVVPCLIGPPGIGKTQACYQFAGTKPGMQVTEMVLSQRLPTEISGLVMPDSERKSMEVFDHSRLAEMKDGDMLLLDELLEAPPSVLSACLTMIQERRLMSGRRLPDIMICAAANPLPSPTLAKLSLRQRFMFVKVEFDFPHWKEYVEGRYDLDAGYLRDLIATEGETWNVMTPRTCTKLISMRSRCTTEKEVLSFEKFACAMFHGGVVDAFRNAFGQCDMKKRIIQVAKDAYQNAIVSNIVPDRSRVYSMDALDEMLKDCDMSDMLELFDGLGVGDFIKDALNKVDV